MTVQQLINELLAIKDKSMDIILQKDAEGNGYSPLRGVDIAWYKAENTWSGDCYHIGDPDAPDRCVDCIVLHPIN